MREKIEKSLKKAKNRLDSWFKDGDCDDQATEDWLMGVIHGLEVALLATKGEND
jgi:hypothetical protein